MPQTVLFALPASYRYNSRAQKQISALLDIGLHVHLIEVADDQPAIYDPTDRISITAQRGPVYFYQLHRRIRRAAASVQADIYHASGLYVLTALAQVAKKHKARLVYDARELYSDVSGTVGRPWSRKFWSALERHHIRNADAVITVSDGIAAHLAELYHITTPTVVYNAPDTTHPIKPKDIRRLADIPRGQTVILHLGGIRRDRGCDTLVKALADVPEAHLVFLGDGDYQPRIEALVDDLDIRGRVRFLPPRPPDELLQWTTTADIGVTLLQDTCLNHRLALPNKLFEYLAAGVPVLTSNLPEMHRVVDTYDVGRSVDPANSKAVATTLRAMIDDVEARRRWSANSGKVLETFGWAHASQVFVEGYRKILDDQFTALDETGHG